MKKELDYSLNNCIPNCSNHINNNISKKNDALNYILESNYIIMINFI